MLQKATLVLAFSILLLGCQAKKVPLPSSETILPVVPGPARIDEPIPRPDLAISDIALDGTGGVIATLSNCGKGVVPPAAGSLKIYVDGELKWSISLDDIPDRAFFVPAGATRYSAPVEVKGTHEVRALIQSNGVVWDDDESNNLMTKVLSFEREVRLPPSSPPLASPPRPSPSLSSPSPPLPVLSTPEPEDREEMLPRPDVVLTDLFLNAKRRLVVHLSNNGDAPFLLKRGSLKIFVDKALEGSYTVGELCKRRSLSPKEGASFETPTTIKGRHEVDAHLDISPDADDGGRGSKSLTKILEGVPIGPDIMVKDLVLTEDLELSIILSNVGETELRRGTTLKVRVIMNDRKVSEFDHLIDEPLRPNSGSRYIIEPPYRISVGGNARVRVTVWPKHAEDDIRPGNNALERDFMIFSFRIDPQTSQEFAFFPSSLWDKDSSRSRNIKTELRWDGGGAPLRLSLKREGNLNKPAQVSGKSPLEMEVAAEEEKGSMGRAWRFLVTNLMEKTAEGHLIVQSP